uniref:Uncharacterized protein n=1 Tax=Salarias fasciatus TaxID=181472 RepID=A0A672FTU8_SALFA
HSTPPPRTITPPNFKDFRRCVYSADCVHTAGIKTLIPHTHGPDPTRCPLPSDFIQNVLICPTTRVENVQVQLKKTKVS